MSVPVESRPPRRSIPLYLRVLIGVFLGAAVGMVFGTGPILPGLTTADLGLIGTLVIRMLKALAAPLILFAIIDSFAQTHISARHGVRLIVICLFNVSVAFSIGLVIMNALHPGASWRGHLQQLEQAVQKERADGTAPRLPGGGGTSPSATPSLSPLQNLSSYVPETLIDPFVKNSIVMIVLIGVFTGAALRKVKDRQLLESENSIAAIERGVSAIFQILIQMLEWLVQTVPFAVFGAVAKVVGESGLGVFGALWVFLVTLVFGLAIHSLLYYPLVAWVVGKKTPRQYVGVGADAIITGFSCNSSLATVPVTLRCLERMGVSQQSARLSACVGTNLNNDGITLYEAMAALFLAQAVGFDLNLSQQFGVILASLMTGIGIAGIPEAGLIILPLVLSSVGLPEAVVAAAIPLVLPVDWIIARCRSAVNVMSDMLVAILLDRF